MFGHALCMYHVNISQTLLNTQNLNSVNLIYLLLNSFSVPFVVITMLTVYVNNLNSAFIFIDLLCNSMFMYVCLVYMYIYTN